MAAIIKVENISKEFRIKEKEPGLKGSLKSLFTSKYKSIDAVDNISFNVNKGEVVGFIGPNGAGKSTTIKMMTGILFPSSGKINVINYDPQKERKKLAFKVGTVFGQKPQLWYHLPAIDTFNLFAKIYEIPEKQYQQRLKELIKTFEVEEVINQPVRKLSLGQRMRCEMIASLLHNPEVLFLDEPTIGMDIVAKKRIRELIKNLNENDGVTVILTSHDLEDVEQVCKRLIIINNGKIVYDGSTKGIREKYLNFKIIQVILNEKTESLNLGLKNVKAVFKGKFRHVIEIDTSKHPIQEVVKKIVSKYNVEDINILDPPIEEIISRIYQNKTDHKDQKWD
ncbi:ABC transporter [Candidatus Woesearchaeota archaeon CG_4_10_14_0_2_um_filter_33_13]|nr:MAG: ABC transporter [Candidatus Woesearchaeota archaeon CG_4_10_14_0_2_um_filter_33_13]